MTDKPADRVRAYLDMRVINRGVPVKEFNEEWNVITSTLTVSDLEAILSSNAQMLDAFRALVKHQPKSDRHQALSKYVDRVIDVSEGFVFNIEEKEKK